MQGRTRFDGEFEQIRQEDVGLRRWASVRVDIQLYGLNPGKNYGDDVALGHWLKLLEVKGELGEDMECEICVLFREPFWRSRIGRSLYTAFVLSDMLMSKSWILELRPCCCRSSRARNTRADLT